MFIYRRIFSFYLYINIKHIIEILNKLHVHHYLWTKINVNKFKTQTWKKQHAHRFTIIAHDVHIINLKLIGIALSQNNITMGVPSPTSIIQ